MLVPQQFLFAILFPRNRLIPARMSHSRKNSSFDFFKPLNLRQKHIFCKSGDDKLLGLVCFIIWRRKIFFTTFCFIKSCDLVEIWKMSFSCGNPWIPQERSLFTNDVIMTSSQEHLLIYSRENVSFPRKWLFWFF